MDNGFFQPSGARFKDLEAEVQDGLGLIDSDTADAIIGEADEGYQALITAARSAMTMLWAMMKAFGVKENPKTLKSFSQAMVVMLTLVHYAYALGMRRSDVEETGSGGQYGR